jgi:predicted nucleotidyltransferase component of viral defense system
MTLYPEILGKRQLAVLERLGPILSAEGYHLAGGTALALQLGHRRSVDLDWFTPRRIEDPSQLAQQLRDQSIALTTTSLAPGTLHGTVQRVRVSLLEYRYPLVKQLLTWRDYGVALARVADLAAMKLAALAQRGARKDFVDVYAVASVRVSLRQMLRWYEEKFSTHDIAHVLYSLIYFDEANRERMPAMLWPVRWQEIKAALRDWVEALSR